MKIQQARFLDLNANQGKDRQSPVPTFPIKSIAFLILATLLALTFTGAANSQTGTGGFAWGAIDAMLKVPRGEFPVTETPLHLNAARQEYAPFQIIMQTGNAPPDLSTLQLTYPAEYFETTVYVERYLDLTFPPDSIYIFSLVRMRVDALPDGLQPLAEASPLSPNDTAMLWVDVLVKPGTPAGDYAISVALENAPPIEVGLTVYDVDLLPTPSMNMVIPIDQAWEIAAYAESGQRSEYHEAVNALLQAHYLTSGNFAHDPEYTPEGWDFSQFGEELALLPPGVTFHAPSPYSFTDEAYLFPDENGEYYTVTNFDDPYFVQQLQGYYTALAAYLRDQNRLEYALTYPSDETVWVADEPYHNGPSGFEHLAKWTEIVRAAGLRMRASGVNTTPVGPLEFGWLPSEEVADDLHVHVDTFDGGTEAFLAWQAQGNGKNVSLYLNQYGDLIDMPAGVQRGLIWHAYGRGVREIAGYAVMEWPDIDWNLVNPWTEPELVFPQSNGYGQGALVWPGPLPSVRLKLLREGVEDARLLDLYANIAGADKARELAACLTPGPLGNQNPPHDLWDNTHINLLVAISTQQIIVPDCIESNFTESQVVFDFDSVGASLDSWELTGVEAAIEDADGDGNHRLKITFNDPGNEAGYYFGGQDWSQWQAIQVEVHSESPYFSELDLGLSDDAGNYLLLNGGAIIMGPNGTRLLTIPLAQDVWDEEPFDWTTVNYLGISSSVETTQTNGEEVTFTYPIGSRTMSFDNFTLVR